MVIRGGFTGTATQCCNTLKFKENFDMLDSLQEQFWAGEFGNLYIDRNNALVHSLIDI